MGLISPGGDYLLDFLEIGQLLSTYDGDLNDRSGQRRRLLHAITNSMHMSLGEFRELVMDREAWRAAIHRIAKSLTRLSN